MANLLQSLAPRGNPAPQQGLYQNEKSDTPGGQEMIYYPPGKTPNPSLALPGSPPPSPTPPTPAPVDSAPKSPLGINAFANLIKTKYPAYQNVDNATLVEKVLAKYPQYSSSVHVPSPAAQKIIDTPVKGTSVASHLVSGTRDALGDLFVKPFVQTGVSAYNAGAAFNDIRKNNWQPSGQATQDLTTPRNLGILGNGVKPFSNQTTQPNGMPGPGMFDAASAGFQMAGTADAAAGLAKKLAPAAQAGLEFLSSKGDAMAAEKVTNQALDITKPAMNKKLSINTLKQSGKVTATGEQLGASEPGLFKSATPNATPKDTEVAKSVSNLVSKNNSPVKNITNINQEISRVSSQEVEPALKANKTPLPLSTPNGGGVIDRIKAIEPNRLIKSDASMNNTYNQVKELMLENITKNAKNANAIDSNGLWKARISFRQAAEDQFGDAIYNPEKNSAVKQAIRDVAEKANSIIGENNSTFRPQMNKITNMYSARDNIAESNYKLLTGQSGKIPAFLKNHPTTTKVGAGLLGGGILEEFGRRLLAK